MTVYQDSRYAGAVQQLVNTDRGQVLTIYMQPPRTSFPYRLYQAVEGDTFDLLAWRLFSDPRLWWRIADLNPQVFYAGDIPPGTLLRMPA